MKILAIDSTATIASAALTEDEKLIALFTIKDTLTHSETLLPMVKALLDTAKTDMAEIDLFACAAGPGSFTGVRIGVSLIKGLAFGTKKPCVGVSTLEALAENLSGVFEDGIICPAMDARRGQLYNALFSGGTRLTEDRLISLEQLEAELSQKYCGRRVYFTGDGYTLAYNGIKSNAVAVCETPALLRPQSGYSVALCAKKRYESRTGTDGFSDQSLQPVYLRPSQAEREKKAAKDEKGNQ